MRAPEQLPVDTEAKVPVSMTKQESGSHKAQTCWVKCPFPVWQVLLSLCPYRPDTLPKCRMMDSS